jgi:hypothetical protein
VPQYQYKVLYGLPPGSRPGLLVARETKEKMLSPDRLEEQLNILSSEGWEVIASHTGTWGAFVLGGGFQTPVLHVMLRRPRTTE